MHQNPYAGFNLIKIGIDKNKCNVPFQFTVSIPRLYLYSKIIYEN
jgi:hypothetical protein